ncbi:UNVERIFIED_ORG: hypothetical protein ABIC62_006574 [Burkholderia sp. 1595]|uniref:Uncharacterized protein n=1 Tax=Paraburkholderia terricola TaxID=169427 RepID=A0ABU1M2C4_9BURK|nr:hypothetical protein [Paraburkholderia terricola]
MVETLDDYFHRTRGQRDGGPLGGHIDRHSNAGRERAFEQFVWPHPRVASLAVLLSIREQDASPVPYFDAVGPAQPNRRDHMDLPVAR